MSRTFLADRILVARRTGILAIGDALMILAFVVGGEIHHGGGTVATLITFLQFQFGWLVAAILFGAYADDALATWSRSLGLAVGSWFVGSLIAQGIRVVSSPTGGVQVVFVLVAFGVGGVLLTTWRLISWYSLRA